MPPTNQTPKKKRAYLDAFRRTLLVTKAAEDAGIHRSTAYDWYEKDEAFAREWDDIVEESTEMLEREAFRRAAQGVEEPVFQGGQQVGAVRKFSDTLMIFLLKARRPEKYRERHEVKHSGVIEQRVKLNLSRLTDEQLAALEAIQPDAEPDAD